MGAAKDCPSIGADKLLVQHLAQHRGEAARAREVVRQGLGLRRRVVDGASRLVDHGLFSFREPPKHADFWSQYGHNAQYRYASYLYINIRGVSVMIHRNMLFDLVVCPHNPLVLGSNPGGPTTKCKPPPRNLDGGFFHARCLAV